MAETRKRPRRRAVEEAAAAACPVAFCPLGMLLTVSGQVRPEVVEHLLAAGRELMLAVKAVLDARAEAGGTRLEKIDLE